MRVLINFLLRNSKTTIASIIVIVMVSFLSYTYMKIQSLENTVSARNQRVEYLETEYRQLKDRSDAIEEDFNEFVIQVRSDLNRQRKSNAIVRNVNEDYQEKIQRLENEFVYDEQGNLRDWDDIIDRKSSILEDIINQRTGELGNEFENINNR